MSNTYSLQISRNNNQEITLRVRDNLSRVQFLELKLTSEQFASAITGLSLEDVAGEVRGLENVGKTKIRESRCVKLPEKVNYLDKKEIQLWLIEEFKEGGKICEPDDGWILDSYLGSQNSVTFKHGERWVRYGVYKYVEAQE